MSKKVLGKGLEALIGQHEPPGREFIHFVEVAKIEPNKYQPRKEFDKQKLDELIASIKEKGVVQPILIRPKGDGYELIAGERRLRAVKSLGYHKIPAVVRDVDDMNAVELSLIENIQREELNPIEEANAYRRLIDEFKFTQEMVGQAVGKDRATIANSLRLLTLPKKIQELLSNGLLSVGHAKLLLSIENKDAQVQLSQRVIRRGLSVRALEKIIRKRTIPKKSIFVSIDDNLRWVEEALQEKLGTKVRIIRQKKGGQIRIEYYTETDLNRILKTLGV